MLLTALALTQSEQAATVTTTAEDGPGSLRQAIANATPGETIRFSVIGTNPRGRGEPLRRDDDRLRHRPGPATITLTSGELVIDKDLTIAGPGADLLTIQRSTDTNAPAFRIMNVLTGVVTLSGLTISNGKGTEGGGLRNSANLELRNCVIQGNAATAPGGGIFNSAILDMSYCLVSANSTTYRDLAGFRGYGGGIYNSGSATGTGCIVDNNSVVGIGMLAPAIGGGICTYGALALTNSTIAGNVAIRGPTYASIGGGMAVGGSVVLDGCTLASNSADFGAGIYNGSALLTLARCTVSSNSGAAAILNWYFTLAENCSVSGNQGVGVWNGIWTVLRNDTITANVGGGVENHFNLDIKSCVVAGNVGGTDLAGDFFSSCFEICPGDIRSQGFNLIGSTNGYVFHPGPNDQFNVSAELLRLGPLQNNGGPTFTHQLLCGSVAINAGDNTGAPPTDQRGFPRIMGGTIDIGAYESGNQPGEVVNADGCSVSDLCPCSGPWRNHGEFMKCVVRGTADFVAQGLMSEAERGRLISEAARSGCGR